MQHLRVEFVSRPKADPGSGGVPDWFALINGVEVPVAGFSVDQAADGSPLVSLAFAPDSLSIGDPPTSAAPQIRDAAPEKPKVKAWGDPTVPDPRANIPGWQPETLGGQVADHAFREQSARSGMVRLAGTVQA